MDSAISVDAALSLIAAAACMPYLRFLWKSEAPAGGRAAIFLVVMLAALMVLRGIDWMNDGIQFNRLTFAAATLLPLAITLFCERILRRHHPLWLKLFTLTVTLVFFVLNLLIPLAHQPLWPVTFALVLATVVTCNGVMLLRGHDELGVEERRLVSALVLVALLATPLLVSDFRTLIGYPPVRLGSLAAMLFIHVMLAAEARLSIVRELITRVLVWVALGLVLAGLFAWVLGFAGEALWHRTLSAWPVAIALLMFGAIVASSRALSVSSAENHFLRWLQATPLDDAETLLAGLRNYPQTQSHLRLQESDLDDYDASVLWRLADSPVSLSLARVSAGCKDPLLSEAGEQWLDLLERHRMNYALPIRAHPPLLVLLQMPSSSSENVSHLRAGIIQRLAQRLAIGP